MTNETTTITELLKSGVNINFTITSEDLRVVFKEMIEETKRDLQEIVLSEKSETYPTINQVTEIFNVDKSTLWRWNKSGYLKHIEFGGGRRYKMSEVKALMNGGCK